MNNTVQLSLLDFSVVAPDPADYDVILINLSGGKDSQVLLDHLVVDVLRPAGLAGRAVAVHADLGRVEWPGARELAEAHARHYGLRFEVVRREKGDLLHQLEHERRKFPDAARRWCTSDQKAGPVRKLITRLVTEVTESSPGRQVRILNCMGLRAQESACRAKRVAFSRDERISNGRRIVDTWLPIHDWTVDQVWARIHESGVPYHPIYQELPRLSCSMCVLASRSGLVRSAQLRPDLAAEYVRIEAAIGHDFRQGMSMASIVEEAQRGSVVGHVEAWVA